MNRQLYQNAGMVSPMQQGIGSMMPAGAQQDQVPQKDYAKIKQILRELYAKDPEKFKQIVMKLKDKIPPQVLRELIQTIQGEDGARSMAASGGIMTVPRAQYGFGSFVSSITGGISDVLGGAADAIGGVVDTVGDVISDVDLGDVATAVAFVYGGPQAAAMVNSATGGTGNKYLDMGLNLYAAGSGGPGEGFSLSNLGGSFAAGDGQAPDIFSGGDFGNILTLPLDIFGTKKTIDGKDTTEKKGDGKNSTSTFEDKTSKILGELLKGGVSLYAGYKGKEDAERINKIVEQDYRNKLAAMEAKRSQYNRLSTLGTPTTATAEDVVRTPARYGGRMNYAYGNLVQDGIMAAPQIADQMGMPVGNPRQNQQGVAELDYRDEGGFVPPIGIKEKEDDIPAMLSNNEFVFTAKAVKNADPEGKQDPERGAKRMYTIMKQLEGGGMV